MKFYFGVYRNLDNVRVMQVATEVDSLSCEILASQFGDECLKTLDIRTVKEMIIEGKKLAKEKNCKYLETMCEKRKGGYKKIKIC